MSRSSIGFDSTVELTQFTSQNKLAYMPSRFDYVEYQMDHVTHTSKYIRSAGTVIIKAYSNGRTYAIKLLWVYLSDFIKEMETSRDLQGVKGVVQVRAYEVVKNPRTTIPNLLHQRCRTRNTRADFRVLT